MTEDFEKELLTFAKDLREKAKKENTPLEESINAFKALTAFYAIFKKHAAPSEDGVGTTFDDLQNEVNEVVRLEAQNGRAKVRDRTG